MVDDQICHGGPVCACQVFPSLHEVYKTIGLVPEVQSPIEKSGSLGCFFSQPSLSQYRSRQKGDTGSVIIRSAELQGPPYLPILFCWPQ